MLKCLEIWKFNNLFFQARIQAQQLADKENKLLQFLEDRQEAAIRRVAYGRDASYSATSLSSNSSNSMTAGVGVRPGNNLKEMGQLVKLEMFKVFYRCYNEMLSNYLCVCSLTPLRF